MTQNLRFEPVRPDQRIELIDILRGFALFGMLVVNMMNYGAGWPKWTGSVDTAFLVVEVFVFDQRFWHLFSILFGLGFAIQLIRAEAKGVNHVPVYLRRLAILLGFGAFAEIVSGVDILTSYAILGVLLLPVRRWSPKAVLMLALLIQLAPAIQLASQRYVHENRMRDAAYAAEFEETRQLQAEEGLRRRKERNEVLATGSFIEVVSPRARNYLPRLFSHWLEPRSESWWGFFAMFLVGLYAGKREIFQKYPKHRGFVKAVGWIGFSVGVVGMSCTVWEWLLVNEPLEPSILTETAFRVVTLFGFTGMTFFYAYVLSEWSLTRHLRFLQRGFAASGRMALTNYLLHGVIMNVVFMGWGLGFFGQFGPAKAMLLSIPIYLVLMMFSLWWMGRFRFGPAEWLWRTLTYARLQPMRTGPSTMTRRLG
jgi:uncharacterized protein